MYLNYTKVLTSIGLLFVAILASIIPAYIALSLFILFASFIGLYYVLQNYDIDYKYWFSFIGQLLALIVIVGGFVMLFTAFVNLIAP